MSQDKLKSLELYLKSAKDKLKDIPKKHLNRIKAYQDFLTKEIKMTEAKIDGLRLIVKK